MEQILYDSISVRSLERLQQRVVNTNSAQKERIKLSNLCIFRTDYYTFLIQAKGGYCTQGKANHGRSLSCWSESAGGHETFTEIGYVVKRPIEVHLLHWIVVQRQETLERNRCYSKGYVQIPGCKDRTKARLLQLLYTTLERGLSHSEFIGLER